MDFTKCLAPQDVVKLCYQAAFGVEHMLGDTTKALAYFREEYAKTSADDKPLAEYISPDVCRVNLGAWKRLGLNPDWLWNLFVSSVFEDSQTRKDIFENYLDQAGRQAQLGAFPFSNAKWENYIKEYTGKPVRHSEIYREKEKPAYRILSGWAVTMLPILESMAGLSGGVIAIDGRAASGKTTFANRFVNCFFGNKPIIIRMDDFFLPSELRTPGRPNIHHERFAEEVLPYIRSGKAFEYRKFDCRIMDYSGMIKIESHPWRIVEGVYSHHPIHGEYADIRVFLEIDLAEQRTRIKKRNSPEIAADYFSKWIPMEETYFEALSLGGTICCTPKK